MVGACSTYEEEESCVQYLVEKTEGKRPLGRPRRRREDNIKGMFRKRNWEAWTILIWLSIGTGGGLL
jgi:hypothetical protein